ncbi:MAG: rod shape-determining protein MreC [Armatimonadetes bacterium]|nr:rod shape-determining protein MreC [Armatimonadota bacterium]
MMHRARGRREWQGLAAALLLCAGLTALHRQRTHTGRADPVVGVVRDAALVPTQSLLFGVGQWWQGHVTALAQGPRLARENARLQAEAETLQAQNTALMAAQAENDRLRRLLGFERRSPRRLLAAEVIALKPTPQTDTLILGRGGRDGVRPQQIVLSPDGALVGQVLDVSPRACSVLLLTDTGSSAGAEIVRPGQPLKKGTPRIGICQGDRAGHLLLTFPRIDADVRPGDRVVTSGLGTVFPKGLLLGVVVSVSSDRTRSVKTAALRPAVDFDHLEEAFLAP